MKQNGADEEKVLAVLGTPIHLSPFGVLPTSGKESVPEALAPEKETLNKIQAPGE